MRNELISTPNIHMYLGCALTTNKEIDTSRHPCKLAFMLEAGNTIYRVYVGVVFSALDDSTIMASKEEVDKIMENYLGNIRTFVFGEGATEIKSADDSTEIVVFEMNTPLESATLVGVARAIVSMKEQTGIIPISDELANILIGAMSWQIFPESTSHAAIADFAKALGVAPDKIKKPTSRVKGNKRTHSLGKLKAVTLKDENWDSGILDVE